MILVAKMPKPKNPYFILLTSIIPGAGHVFLGLPQRGLMFLFFTIILGWVSVRVMPSDMSFFSRHVGGIFIYGISILDAYKIARIRSVQYGAKS
jgi:hypothetical protein